MKTCPKCGTLHVSAITRCGDCGTPLPQGTIRTPSEAQRIRGQTGNYWTPPKPVS